jgi:multiple sugar transport system substrate-binding protein
MPPRALVTVPLVAGAIVFTIVLPVALGLAGCTDPSDGGALTFSGSAVGREGDVVRAQLARWSAERGIPVEIRATPDAADQRHQLYVQWLNARSPEPDVLQLDVVWTPEFAAAGWLLALDRFAPAADAFFPATVEANRWSGALYGLPWFVDVGMLYWRTDLFERAPATFDEMRSMAGEAMREPGVRYGLVWQGARYEGLLTVFLEHLGGFGGRILDDRGAVVVDSDEAVRALTWMRDAIHRDGIVPATVLTWHEEETRFAFQNGAAAAMRNWPYAHALLAASESAVAGRFAVAPMPAAPGAGTPTAALGGAQLAINRHSRQPEQAWELIEFLVAPEQMLERAREVAQFPSRHALYEEGGGLEDALGISPQEALAIIAAARPRPVTPVYTQLSEILQIRLHRALTRQQEPRPALGEAAREMRALLDRTGLAPGASGVAPSAERGGLRRRRTAASAAIADRDGERSSWWP